MKSILVTIFLCLSTTMAFCQFVNGTITYSMAFKSQDPSDTKTAQSMSTMGPDQMIIGHKGTSALITWKKGNDITQQFLTIDSTTYMLDSKDKIAYKMQTSNRPHKSLDELTVSKTEEFENILGHRCQKYTVTTSKGKFAEEIWAATDLQIPAEVMAMMMKKTSNSKFASQIKGIPLKVTSGSGNFNMVMQATSLSKIPPSSADLVIPAGYEVKPYGLAAGTKSMFRNLLKNK